jgi:hypothetical protein
MTRVADLAGAEQYYPADSTNPERFNWLRQGNGSSIQTPRYSSDWANGGPLIPGGVVQYLAMGDRHNFTFVDGEKRGHGEGPTLLIAAMRALVSSVHGETVSEVADKDGRA